MSKPQVFLALDFKSAADANPLIEKIRPINPCLKIGLELFTAEGPAYVQQLAAKGAKIFLDLKFHDIPNTVAGAVKSATRLGVSHLNVHCGGGLEMLQAAVQARDEEAARLGIAKPVLLGVTVLTSLDDRAIQEIGFTRSVSAQVKTFVELALEAGLDGVVCSALELPLVKSLAGPDFKTMVPGIRPAGSNANDQKRTMSPSEAAKAGASALVIGRPVSAAADPVAAMKKILAEL